SDKEQGDRGRWGVGKFVFPRSSRVSSFWAVTVRHGDLRRLLMGRAILKTHAIDGRRFVADGYFGEEGDVGQGDHIGAPIGGGAAGAVPPAQPNAGKGRPEMDARPVSRGGSCCLPREIPPGRESRGPGPVLRTAERR